jgi:hypothetical protein
MVIEHFKNRDGKSVYERFREKGRMMPEGLTYLASWTETNCDRCFQVMETDNPELFKQWTSNWDDLADFEILPVVTGQEMATRMLPSS